MVHEGYIGSYNFLTVFRYLLESGLWNSCQDLLEVAFQVCDDTDSILYAHLLNSAGCLRDKRNRPLEALNFFQESKTLREKHLGHSHEELANTYNNMGLSLMSCCRYKDALESFKLAIKIDLLKPERERNKILHIRHLNIGCAYAALEQYDDAKMNIEKGRGFAIKTFGAHTHYESV